MLANARKDHSISLHMDRSSWISYIQQNMNLLKQSNIYRLNTEHHIYIEYFMESALVRCLNTSCGVSEIEQVSEANE